MFNVEFCNCLFLADMLSAELSFAKLPAAMGHRKRKNTKPPATSSSRTALNDVANTLNTTPNHSTPSSKVTPEQIKDARDLYVSANQSFEEKHGTPITNVIPFDLFVSQQRQRANRRKQILLVLSRNRLKKHFKKKTMMCMLSTVTSPNFRKTIFAQIIDLFVMFV